jgi:beta-glucosidase
VEAARKADVVVLVLGDKSGLTPDCTSGETRDRVDLGLPGVQQELAEAVAAVGKPVVAVLVNGRPLSVSWLQEHVSAILEAWMPGEEGGRAIGDALFGAVNPGGKLPMTVARCAGQLPLAYNLKPSGGRSNWYGDYVEMPVSPLYPFGHGLSYTRFEYEGLSVSPEEVPGGGTVDIRLRVRNAGERAGDEVVQLYVRDEFAGIPRPQKELKGFVRLSLKPGESREVTFHLPADMLAFYDRDLRLVTEAGRVLVMVGSSSQDIRLQGAFTLAPSANRTVGQRVFACPLTVK